MSAIEDIPSPGKQCHYPNGINTSGKWYARFVTHIFNLFLTRNQTRISEDSNGILIPLEW